MFELWHRGGWVGVDVFFVLSGFLVSGLIFKEAERHPNVSVGRFLLRRGFKIYPSFWVVLVGTILCRFFLNSPLTLQNVLGEILFLQNYVGKLTGTHWTLAVEEHFYLLLAAWVWLVVGRSTNVNQLRTPPSDRFRTVPLLFAAIAFLCLISRVIEFETADYWKDIMKTHLRMDALMFGVLLSWLYHIKKVRFNEMGTKRRVLLAVFGAGLLLIPFVWDSIYWGKGLHLFAYNGFYLGSGALLLAGLGLIVTNPLLVMLARLGGYSYGVYLCHVPWQKYIVLNVIDPSHSLNRWCVYFALYVGGSILTGILLTRWVERPCLNLRDRLFPSWSGVIPSAP